MTRRPLPQPDLLTAEEVGAALGVRPETVRRRARNDLIHTVRTPTGYPRFRRADIERLRNPKAGNGG